ncbi:twin-arginine translocase subunit TatC [Priestia koreensis]|uniref:twin-arginine translocase subunit TatC n=1 Tax=Priestia koreensis TaxID=284581 RepID=UPI001F58F067|nr:twin-arginine translocase subunit TatC [Priestia koreensis]MCM3007094.1 twin-arginine translocase subunit TatC [Priestia koreensis]UNL85228.1 twin-arginine translocase subunit TatC [Priestia koreensis]
MSEKEMSVYDHIGELRKRVILVAVVFLVTTVAGLFFAEPIIRYLQQADRAKDLTMNAFRLTDPIKIYFQFSFVIGCVLTAPLALYQLWAFISPGLYERERKVTLGYIPLSLFLFLAGVAFSYFVLLPYVLNFSASLAENLNVTQVIGINEYFDFLIKLTLPFGLLFQLPVIIMFLTRLGIVTPTFLSKFRRYAYFILLVLAGLISPPDVISQIIVMIPLVILYEISIIISRSAHKKVLEARQLEEMQEEQEKAL